MFTGIIEHIGHITAIRTEGSNRILDIRVPFSDTIQVDQSIAHNGVCLTVTEIFEQSPENGAHYSVTMVDETLKKSAMRALKTGDALNIERSLKIGDRLDGHFVQGHVDSVGIVQKITDMNGSWVFEIGFNPIHGKLLVDKGSICVNGVSLTIVECQTQTFTLAIIPYTYAHTNFQFLRIGDAVNLEFDILGKYMAKLAADFIADPGDTAD